MPRPPLVLESWGRIKRTTVDGKPTAIAHYRDSDGVTRKIQRQGRTGAEAERILVQALKDRLTPSEGITPETRISDLADLWWAEFEKRGRADGTVRRYRQTLDKDVLGGVGGLMIREATVGRLDRFIKAVAEHTGYATARLCAVLLTGMLDLAARHDAVRTNPMRSVAPVPRTKGEIKAYTLDDVAELREILRTWDASLDGRGMARTADLADAADTYLGTGGRTGEVLALRFSRIDFEAEPMRAIIDATVAYDADGHIVIQERTKSDAGYRVLYVPPFLAEVFRRRRETVMGDLVFPSSTGTVRAPSNFLTQWHAALKHTRFEGEVPKTFRSSVATLIKENSTADHAKRQLGHSSQDVTDRHYIKDPHEAPDVTGILEGFNVRTSKPRVNRERGDDEEQQTA